MNHEKKERPAWVKPVGVIQIALALYSAIDVARQNEFNKGSKALWLPVVLFINFFGPIAYFAIGKKK